jgi:hypothetical protein
MSYEAAILSARGDDSVLVKSFIIAADEAAAQWLLTVKYCQPSHEFTFGVGITFISYPLVLTPLV